ncbi:MAG: glycosyltransferase family 9 protein [Gammaproteobacteria bacterium]|nr:glycosyltransferase family 9 protein [Gammaproteobacteria bacterium]MDE2345497.1 glycosyltransferase family 9 protein [Gammaproteobacteria bacterium]
MPQMIKPPARVCILRLSAVGDVCHTLPVVRSLQAAWPGTHFTWIIGRLEASLVADIPGIEFIIFDKAKGLAAYRTLRKTLRGRRFDLLLHMQMSLRASLASTYAVRSPIKLGFDRQRAHDWQWLFTNRRIDFKPRQHVMDSLFGFAEACGVSERVLRWDIPVPENSRAYAREQIPEGDTALIISPCANARFRNFRNWRAERYAELADYAVEKHGLRVLLSGGPSAVEREVGERIQAAMRQRAINLIGQTDLKQLLALLQRARVLISPDSGPAHMATAVGTPVIGLYASTNPERAAPYLSRRWCVNRYPEAMRQFNHLDAATARWGTRVRDPAAMDLIGVADVTAKLDELLAASDRGESLLT